MKAYGNEFTYQIDSLNASKHRPSMTPNVRKTTRRLAKKTRRAKDKEDLLRQEKG